MTDPTRPPRRGVEDPQRVDRPEYGEPDRQPGPDDDALSRLRAEIADLSLRLETEVRTGRVVIVDEGGTARIRLTASTDGGSQIVLLDADGFERVRIAGEPDRGIVSVACRPSGADTTQVDIFGLDADETDAAYTGVELVDRGNSVAGFALYEGRVPLAWTALQ